MAPITHQGSHQGALRGSMVIPIDPVSDGEMGYKTAHSDLDSVSSEAGDPPPQYTSPKHQQQDDIEVEELPDDYVEQTKAPYNAAQVNATKLRNKSANDSPAYVEPIGKIPRIPAMSEQKRSAAPPEKLPIHQIPKDHLVGKRINEFGDIVDTDGTVLGCVEGDLPSMVGRTISNTRGDVVGDDGELLGYVAAVGNGQDEAEDNDEGKYEDEGPPPSPSKPESPTWSLAEVMQAMAAAGKTGPGGLRVDARGNIYDAEGQVVGSFHDNVTGWGSKQNAPAAVPGSGASSGGRSNSNSSRGATPRPARSQPPKPAAAASAAAKPKPSPSSSSSSSQTPEQAANAKTDENGQTVETKEESPSDLFLDVKSTMEGIQLTIRIPTMFNGGKPLEPKIVFS